LIAQLVENGYGAVSIGETEDENTTMVASYKEKKCARRKQGEIH